MSSGGERVHVVTDRAVPRGVRVAAGGLPVVLGGLDGTLLVGFVADSGACSTHCFAGLVLHALSPVSTPLRVATFESDPIVALTLGAVLLVLMLAVLWWRAIVQMCRVVSESRTHPVATFGGLWVLALVGTFVLTAVASGLALNLHPLVALVAEVAVWTVVVVGIARRGLRRVCA